MIRFRFDKGGISLLFCQKCVKTLLPITSSQILEYNNLFKHFLNSRVAAILFSIKNRLLPQRQKEKHFSPHKSLTRYLLLKFLFNRCFFFYSIFYNIVILLRAYSDAQLSS